MATLTEKDTIKTITTHYIDLNSGPKILTTAHLRRADSKNH